MKKNSMKGVLYLITAAVIWGFAFTAQVVGSSVTPMLFNFSRYVLGTLSVVPVFLIFERHADDRQTMKTTVKAGLIVGTVLFIASYLQQYGIMLTDSSGKGGFITGLYMIIVPIIGMFMGRRTTLLTWIGAVCGVTGLFLVCMSGGKITITRGDLLLLGCALVYAVHITLIDYYSQKIYSLRFAFFQFFTCMVLNFVGMLIFESFDFAAVVSAAPSVCYCGFMSVGVAYTFQILGQKYCEPTPATVIMSTESVFAAIGGALILHERMSGAAVAGCVLIFAGIVLSQLRPGGKKKEKSEAVKADGSLIHK